MRTIDTQTWGRREHFNLFNSFMQPHFGMCANMDITEFIPYVEQKGYSLTVAMVYIIARAANAVPEFRQRIREGTVVEHEVVHPSTTILVDEDIFTFCTIDYSEEYSHFAETAAKKIVQVRKGPSLEDEPGHDDLLYMTPIPWVAFTSFMHPLPSFPPDSIPRFAWGKYFEEGGGLKMPVGAQAHHALMDGLHMGSFYKVMQDCLSHPTSTLG
jgi:chloramphenicol O-acetyltransferase type A